MAQREGHGAFAVTQKNMLRDQACTEPPAKPTAPAKALKVLVGNKSDLPVPMVDPARAQAVAELLRTKGLEAMELRVESHGERNLLIATPDATAEPRNRRVEILVR